MQPPTGYRVRPATIDDALTIFDIQAAHETPLLGKPGATLEDVADELVEPDFDPDNDGWLVSTDTGLAVGWGWTCRKSDSDNVDIAMYVRPGHDQVGDWLWDRAQTRAVEIGQELGHEAVTIDIGILPGDELVRRIATERGFAPAATFVRMRIDHSGEVAYPVPPPGVTLGSGTDPAVRQDAHHLRNVSFAGHFGSVDRTYEEWAADRESSASHDWAMVHVAYVDGQPAAVVVRTNNFVPDEDCGYVATLGTSSEFQGRGLGSFLLRYAFAADAEQGRVGTILHVDMNPERPALGLYQRNGMHDILTIDVFRRVVGVDAHAARQSEPSSTATSR